MRELEIFNYEGNEVTFKTENGEVMINATEMAKPFGKKVKDWLRLDSTKEYLQALENQRGEDLPNVDNQLVVKIQGGDLASLKQGTWMHELVALDFARWLSPLFAIWCNNRIKELMKYGVTATPEAIERAMTNPDTLILIAKKWKKDYNRRIELEESNNKLQKKATYHDLVIKTQDTITSTQLAASLGMTVHKLNNLLVNLGIQFKRKGKNYYELYAKYKSEDYVKYETYLIPPLESKYTSQTMKWTQKGKKFVIKMLVKNGVSLMKQGEFTDL